MYVLAGQGIGFTQGLSQSKDVCFERSPCYRDIPGEFISFSSKPLHELIPKSKKLDRFRTGSSVLRTFHKPIIKRIARMVVRRSRTKKPFKTIFLIGASNRVGSFRKNCAWGKRRARRVKNQLVRELESLRRGITKDIKFVVLSFGECAPKTKRTRDKRNNYVDLWFSEEPLPKKPR